MKFLEKKWKGRTYRLYAQRDKNSLWIHFQGQTWIWRKSKKLSQIRQKQDLKSQALITATLPGRIHKIFVKKDDEVKKGQSLLILSAMKIEYNFKAEGEGQVEGVFCEPGQTVSLGQKLIKIKYGSG